MLVVPHHQKFIFPFLLYSSRKNPSPPLGRSLEIPRGRGFLKATFLEAMYENKLYFPGGRGGVQKQKPSVGGVWIFSGSSAHCAKMEDDTGVLTTVLWKRCSICGFFGTRSICTVPCTTQMVRPGIDKAITACICFLSSFQPYLNTMTGKTRFIYKILKRWMPY